MVHAGKVFVCLFAPSFTNITLVSLVMHKLVQNKLVFTSQASFAGTVHRWRESHVNGSITFRKHVGELVIGRPGMYYVYSQMYYYDCSTYSMNHYTLLNGKQILGSISSVADCSKHYYTNYQAGVFHLNRGDILKVEVYRSKVYYMEAPYSYFGLFMLYPDQLPVGVPLP